MSEQAHVTSTDAIAALATRLRISADEASRAMENLEVEIRRGIEWVEHDRKDYWTRQLRRAERAAADAKLNLQRARLFKHLRNQRPAVSEEEAVVRKTKRRVEECRDRLAAVSQWARKIDQAMHEYQGVISQFTRWVELDAVKAAAVLDRIGSLLYSYTGLAPARDITEVIETLPPEKE